MFKRIFHATDHINHDFLLAHHVLVSGYQESVMLLPLRTGVGSALTQAPLVWLHLPAVAVATMRLLCATYPAICGHILVRVTRHDLRDGCDTDSETFCVGASVALNLTMAIFQNL